MDDVGILEVTKFLLLEKGWTQGAYAKNSQGVVCFVNDPEAACFCLVGALSVASRGSAYGQVERLNRALRWSLAQMNTGSRFVSDYNDARGRTREEVIALIDKTIERVKVGDVKES